MYHFSKTIQYFTSNLADFYAQNTLKKLAIENADWTNHWNSIEGALANVYSYNWLFSWQNKNILEKSSSGLLFTAKM